MRTDVLDLYHFYESPLGKAARGFVGARVSELWGEAAACRIAGFGYAGPFLGDFQKAERVLALAPAGQGVMRWPPVGANRAGLVEEFHWPLPDSSIDRLLIVHGLEEAGEPRRLMREAWRVLADDGRMIIVAAHRRGLWSMIGTTPFAAGRPFLKLQLQKLLADALFRDEAWRTALFFPPFGARFLLRAAGAWDRAGATLWPGLAGVIIVEATKSLMTPAAQVYRARSRMPRRLADRPAVAGGLSAMDDA